jgi:glycosyltransferase involved in cell wall biosynthesis
VRVLIDYRPALRDRSGVGEYTHGLVKALTSEFSSRSDDRGLDVTLFSSSWKDRLTRPSEFGSASAVDLRVPVAALNFAWHRLEWPPAEFLVRSRFDVTHSMHPLLLPARRAARVVTVHDLNFLTHPERTNREIRRDYPSLARKHAHKADHVVVVSEFTARQVEAGLDIPKDRISVCSPGAPEWTPRTAAPEDGYVLFFGTLEPRKNLGWLLDAYERLLMAADLERHVPRASNGPGTGGEFRARRIPELIIAGKATPEAQPWLDRISRPPLAGHARHLGYVEPNSRRTVYAGARVLVQPSFEEGFGITVLEAMTVGVPIVAAKRGALPEVVGDAGILVERTDAEDLARAIQTMLDEPATAAACAARGLVRARQFRWTETARRVREAYERALEHRASRIGHVPEPSR